MSPVIKSILAKKSGTINTKLESKYLNLGDTALVRFASINEFRSMLQLGHFIEYSGPSPAVIQSSQTIPDMVPKTIEPEKALVPVAPPVTITATESRQCKRCKTMLIITSGIEGGQVLYCANCNKEEPIEELVEEAPEFDTKAEAEAAEAETPKQKTKRSKCNCGKVKSKEALLCKTCITTAELQQAQTPNEE